MKKKLTVNTLALGNLKQRRKQYTIMIIGIILAMVFSSSVLFMTSAVLDSRNELKDVRFGKQEIIWSNVTEDNVQKAKDEGLIGKNGYAHIIGTVSSTDKNYYDMASVGWFDETANELANPLLMEGSMPTKENEIAIESLMLAKMGVSAKVGDTIKLNFDVQNGKGTIGKPTEKEYKLVGILKNKVNYITFASGIDEIDIPSAFVCKDTAVELGGKEKLVCYTNFKTGGVSRANWKKWDKFTESINLDYTERDFAIISHHDVLYTNDSDAYDMQANIIFVIIIIAVLMLAACLSIVNAFNSNLKERKKQIGLLRAVGTTKKQIINIFGREAFIISLIATPISLAISYGIVKAIIGIMGDGYVFNMHLWCVAGSVGFSILSVMISALIPLSSASRITPIQAIRNIENNRKMKTKKIKSKKDFSVSKLLSQRSLAFGKGKQVAVSLVLIIAIIGSGYAFSWYSYAKQKQFSIGSDYSFGLMSDGGNICANFKNSNNGFTEMDKQTAASAPYIDTVYSHKKGNAYMLVPFSTSDYRKSISNRYSRDYEKYNEEDITSENYEEAYFSTLNQDLDSKQVDKLIGTSDNFVCEISSFDSDYFKLLNKRVYDGKINIDKINSGEEIILVAPKKAVLFYDDSKYGGLRCGSSYGENDRVIFDADCDFHAGDEIELAFINADKPLDEEGTNDYSTIIPDNATVVKKTVKIGAIVDGIDDRGSYWVGDFAVLTTHSVMNSLIPNLRYKEINMYSNTEITDEMDKTITEILSPIRDNVDQARLDSEYAFHQDQKQERQKLFIAMMAMVILVFAISISIINNTITASIRNSKQKIGTLRAVGADEKELVKSYIYQLMSMLLWGTGFGLGGFGISYIIIMLLIHKHNHTSDFTGIIFNPIGAIVFVVLVFAVCSFNLWLKVRKEMKNSIVENIREL